MRSKSIVPPWSVSRQMPKLRLNCSGGLAIRASIASDVLREVQSWIGIFIQAVNFCLSLKALATIKSGGSPYESFTREM